MSSENPADVIEAAARALHDMNGCGDPYGTCISTSEDYRGEARALHAAGLLADPADRGGSYGQPTYEDLRTACHLLGKRLKRAEAEVAELREKWLTFTSRLGFGDNKTERAAELSEMVDPIEEAFAAQRDHQECAVTCELCGDPLASKTCDECHGSGCLPNSALAYLECGTCAGVGKIHEGCVEKSYTDLVAEVAELRVTIDRVRALADEWESEWDAAAEARAAELRAALGGAGDAPSPQVGGK